MGDDGPNLSCVNVIFDKRKYQKVTQYTSKGIKKGSLFFKISHDSKQLKKRVLYLLKLISERSVTLNIRFCDCEEIEEYNFQYRGKSRPTDVLSFSPLLEDSLQDDPPLLGDILVCIPVCEHTRGKASLVQELERMLIHGLSHLKGFDHERNEAAYRVQMQLEKLLQKELHQKYSKPDWLTFDEGGV